MRILLDECLPEILRDWLADPGEKTVRELEQDLRGRRLGVVVLPSNRLKVLRGLRC